MAEVEDGLDEHACPARDIFAAPLSAGLWLAASVVRELLSAPGLVERFADGIRSRGLMCHTLNAFPYGDFHDERVKETVYVPDWTRPERLQYTLDCAAVLASLLPAGRDGSISTMPLGFKPFDRAANFLDLACDNLIELARRLRDVRDETGKTIRVAVEPEPFCLLETTGETVEFFERLWRRAEAVGEIAAVREHVGVCYDVCHQAVEFEDVGESIRSLARAGVRINKLHITCALELDDVEHNLEGRRALARFVEPRYLHQTMARTASGKIARAVDLTEELALRPGPEFLTADCWRVHFHVPVDAERMGPLKTTRPELVRALRAVADLDYAPHLEVETYTWNILAETLGGSLAEGLARELTATEELLKELRTPDRRAEATET